MSTIAANQTIQKDRTSVSSNIYTDIAPGAGPESYDTIQSQFGCNRAIFRQKIQKTKEGNAVLSTEIEDKTHVCTITTKARSYVSTPEGGVTINTGSISAICHDRYPMHEFLSVAEAVDSYLNGDDGIMVLDMNVKEIFDFGPISMQFFRDLDGIEFFREVKRT